MTFAIVRPCILVRHPVMGKNGLRKVSACDNLTRILRISVHTLMPRIIFFAYRESARILLTMLYLPSSGSKIGARRPLSYFLPLALLLSESTGSCVIARGTFGTYRRDAGPRNRAGRCFSSDTFLAHRSRQCVLRGYYLVGQQFNCQPTAEIMMAICRTNHQLFLSDIVYLLLVLSKREKHSLK